MDVSSIQLSDDDFLDRAGKVGFRVNRYDQFVNDSLLRELEEVVLPRINRDGLRLKRMVLRGAASPEGPVPNNRMLGRRRAETLANFLRARLSIPVDENNFSSEAVTEDYRLLCTMMRRANDPALPTVQELCDYHLPRYEYTILKRKLQALQGGRLWRRLLNTYYSDLRAARLILFFEKVSEPEPEPVEETDSLYSISKGKRTDSKTAQVAVRPQQSTEAVTPPEPSLVHILPRREVLSVKSNLLLDFAYVPGYNRWCPIPNVAIEYYPKHGHFTYGASFDCPWWQHYDAHKYFQIRNYQLETRYYFRSGDIRKNQPGKGAAFRGLYVQAYAHAAIFGICFGPNRGWMGEGVGGGLGLGYVLPLTKKGHWRLEFAAQAGYFTAKYDPYQYGNPLTGEIDHLYYYKWTGTDPTQFKKRQYRFNWVGPTRVGITLSYDLLYRRIVKKGISFKPREKVEGIPLSLLDLEPTNETYFETE